MKNTRNNSKNPSAFLLSYLYSFVNKSSTEQPK